MTDDNRTAYLAGIPEAQLDPDERVGLDELRALLADPALWAVPSSGLEDSVVDAISQAKEPGTPGPAPYGTRLLARRNRPRKRFAQLAVAVAGAAAAVGLAIGLSGGGSHPTQFRAALTGTALAPDARGGATLTKTLSGWRITLDASGLPRLDNGAFYEAWLRNAAGVLVPIGTFNLPTSVTLWSGVPPTSFPTVTVTRQQANGNEASSGQKVLVGTAQPAH